MGVRAFTGQIAGRPSADRIRVYLYAEPGALFMKHLHQGQHFQMKLVGSAMSSATGAYTIRVTDPAAITSVENQEHIANLWVMAADHGYVAWRGVAVRVANGGTMLASMFGKASLSPLNAPLQMRHWHVQSSHSPAAVDVAATSGCWVLSVDVGQVESTIGPMYSTIRPVVKKFSYVDGSTTGTDIALTSDASGDNYTLSGNTDSNSVTNDSATQGFPNSTGNISKDAQIEMELGFFNTCQISGDGAIFPYAVNGGAAEPDHPKGPPQARNCVHELGGVGDNVIEHTTKDETYSQGIDASALGFGFNLSSSTGYTTDAQSEIDFNAQGYACGGTNFPLRSDPGPSYVVADQFSTGNPVN
jgi:hypothetical protein